MADMARVFVAVLTAVMFGGLGVAAQAAVEEVEIDVTACAFPDQPDVPDGAVATVTEMQEAGDKVRAYINAGQSQLECLDAIQTENAENLTDEQRATITATYNAGVDELNAVAGAYNQAVRTFKARTPEESEEQ